MEERLLPFENFIRTADMITSMFGDKCEAAIHDFRDVSASLVYIKGNVTGRKVGAPATNMLLKEIYKLKDEIKDKFNFTATTDDGRLIKSSILFLRDNNYNVIGCMAVNVDMTVFTALYADLNAFLGTNQERLNSDPTEQSPSTIEDVFNRILEDTLQQFPIIGSPMKREEKVRFVKLLDEKGAFQIMGAVEKISEMLQVTKQSVYNYLDEIRQVKTPS